MDLLVEQLASMSQQLADARMQVIDTYIHTYIDVPVRLAS